MRYPLRIMLLLFALFYILPVLASATIYFVRGRHLDWRSADRSSMHLLPPASRMPAAVVRILSARTVSWRGVSATHSWVVLKERNASSYERFDYVAWGGPIWKDRFAADAKWFGSDPEVTFAADGDEAARMLPAIRSTASTMA